MDEVMNTNTRSMYLMAALAIPAMRARGGGSIVNVGSVQGLEPRPHVAAYSTSKAANSGLTRTIAVDYAKEGIRCNIVLRPRSTRRCCVRPPMRSAARVRPTRWLDRGEDASARARGQAGRCGAPWWRSWRDRRRRSSRGRDQGGWRHAGSAGSCVAGVGDWK